MAKYLISFKNKTYAHLIKLYAQLKERYKGKYSVSYRITGNTGTLKHGYITVV